MHVQTSIIIAVLIFVNPFRHCAHALNGPLANTNAQEIPNYDFKLDQLASFDKAATAEDVEKTWGKGVKIELVTANSPAKKTLVKKYLMDYHRYKFPIFVQFVDNKISDIYLALPTYFLHDVFHQALVNRYQKQDEYRYYRESALYIWKNRDSVRHVYGAACTILCFPIFYARIFLDPEGRPLVGEDQSLFSIMPGR